MVGRDRECKRIHDLLDETSGGRARAVTFRGDPGIGKTRLLEYGAKLAATREVRLRTLWVQGHEAEREIPFAALSALIPLLDDVRADLADAHVTALDAALNLGPARYGDQAGVAAAVLALLAAAAERAPLLLVVDDVQLLDRSSVEVVGFALRRLRSEPVAVLLSARLGGEVPECTEPLLELSEQIELDGLDLPAARELTACSGRLSGPLSEAVWEASGGNPLALLEGLPSTDVAGRDEPLQLPLRLLRGYSQKLVGLPEGTQEAMLVLAVSGRVSDGLDGALRARGRTRADLEAAEEANLVVLGPGTARFTHPLVRSAVVQLVSPARRRAAHRAWVAAYDGRTSPGAVDRRAFHLAEATPEPDEAVAAEIDAAAQAAFERQNFVTAAALYEHASMLTPTGTARASRMLASAVSGQAAGRLGAVGRLLERAIAETDDDGLRTGAMHLQCRVQMWSGNPGQARDQLLDLADRTAAIAPAWSAAMRAQAAVVSIAIGESRAALPMAEQAVEACVGLRDAEILPVLATQAIALAIHGQVAQARAYLDRCQPHLAAQDPLSIDQPLLLIALAQASLGEVAAAVAAIEDLVRHARNAHASGLLPFQLSWLTTLSWSAGHPVDALAHGHAAVQSARESGWVTELSNCLVALAGVEAAVGQADEAIVHLAEAIRLAQGRTGQRYVEAQAARVRGQIALAAGKPRAAAQELRTVGGFAQTAQLGDPVLFSWAADLTEALLRSGERDAAVVAFRSVKREAERTGRPAALASAARCRGLLAETLDDARQHFQEALAHHRQAGDRYELARTQLCFGEVLNRGKQRADARVPLQTAATAFTDLGAMVWLQRAEAALRATGLKARPRVRRAVERLTPKEMQVAVAVADGLTNSDVAHQLVVTPRTVEFHLGNVYRKLGIQGNGARVELSRIRRERPDLLTGDES